MIKDKMSAHHRITTTTVLTHCSGRKYLTARARGVSLALLILTSRIIQPQISAAQSEPVWKDNPAPSDVLQFDLLFNGQYARNNFTDVTIPYDGVDAFAVGKVSYWFNTEETFGPFLEIIPTYASVDEFFWQRHVQANAGVQLYLFGKEYAWDDPWRFVRAVRLFGQWSVREFYDAPSDADLTESDIQGGLDYYYDNLVGRDPLLVFAYQSLTYRKTNFSMDDYSGLLWSGNVKVGPRVDILGSALVPYGVLDFTYAPEHDDRWYENFLRVGGGLRWYPKPKGPDDQDGLMANMSGRFHVFVEGLHNASWLGDEPMNQVEENDLRFGLAFATDGFLAEDFMRKRRATE